MPTPPTGDIAWAASPMHSSPGRYQRSQAVDRDGQELHVVPALELVDAVAEPRRQREDDGAEVGDRLLHQVVGGALRDDEGALPVIAAVEHDEEAPVSI